MLGALRIRACTTSSSRSSWPAPARCAFGCGRENTQRRLCCAAAHLCCFCSSAFPINQVCRTLREADTVLGRAPATAKKDAPFLCVSERWLFDSVATFEQLAREDYLVEPSH